MTSFQSARVLSNYLVDAKLHHLNVIPNPEKFCNNCSEICIKNIEEIDFTSMYTGETHITNHKFDCNN